MKKEFDIAAYDITKTFSKPNKFTLLNKISIEIEKGSSTAIMGASGEGKTTLLHILGTLENFDSGELFVSGANTKNCNLPKLRLKKIGFVFQAYNLLEDLTVLDNLLIYYRIAKEKPSLEKAEKLLLAVGLENKKKIPAKLLSGGEKQRVAIARALISDPDIILADEPSGNLDHANSKVVSSMLINLCVSFKKSLLIVTHDKALASLMQTVYILKAGNLTKA